MLPKRCRCEYYQHFGTADRTELASLVPLMRENTLDENQDTPANKGCQISQPVNIPSMLSSYNSQSRNPWPGNDSGMQQHGIL